MLVAGDRAPVIPIRGCLIRYADGCGDGVLPVWSEDGRERFGLHNGYTKDKASTSQGFRPKKSTGLSQKGDDVASNEGSVVGVRRASQDFKEKIGAAVRRAREDAGLSQGELGAKIGTAYGAISEIERGVTVPNLSTAWALADTLGLSIDDLVGRSTSPGDGLAFPFRNPWPAIREIRDLLDAVHSMLRDQQGSRPRLAPDPKPRGRS